MKGELDHFGQTSEERHELARKITAKEIESHPEIITPEAKLGFVGEILQLDNQELSSILPTDENSKSIDLELLDTTFALASFLQKRVLQEEIAKAIRRGAPDFSGKTLLEKMSEGKTEEALLIYYRAFDFSQSS